MTTRIAPGIANSERLTMPATGPSFPLLVVLTSATSFVLFLGCVVALGRIWLYSKEQVALLREIRDRLPLPDPQAASSLAAKLPAAPPAPAAQIVRVPAR
jgi:hypothetical protein